ncbi:hypothetical protein BDN72DRAFT_495170 [Pluteus cervinus]|uniref:Uncharacterized protein n=1 Tax=Pluteus cervinus TaxID=181527 RepID=A0ACD3AZ72_9AGAR|nr:hypothetical protein BDN72DRAFT_495170 [Pluteus cervinus]
MSVLLKEAEKALPDVPFRPMTESERKGILAEQQKNLTMGKKEFYPVTWRVIGGGVSLSDPRSRTASEADSDYGGVGYRDGLGPSHRKSDVVPGNASKASKPGQKMQDSQDLDDLSEITFPTLAAPPPGERRKMTIETSSIAETSGSSTSPPRARATSNPPTPISVGVNYSALFASAESPD